MAVQIENGRVGGDQVEEGDGIAVADGHLKVTKRVGATGAKTLAIYAPGAWHSATVVTNAKS